MTRPPGDFELIEQPVLSRGVVDRDERLRLDADYQRRTWADARLVVVDENGRTPVSWETRPEATFRETDAAAWDSAAGSGGTLLTRQATSLGDGPPPDAVLLGEADGVPYWTVRGKPDLLAGDDPSEWADLRAAGAWLDALGSGLLTAAVGALNWHDAAGFCARDGSPTHPHNAGWARVCEQGHEEYPRTDPAVICLVHDGADRVLLARQPVWPVGRYSVLAGFVESGESLEACVHREIGEEVGLDVHDVRYLGSQAWPFPRSLMVGFHATADPEAPLTPADGEIADALWITRAELQAALQRGDWAERPPDGETVVLLPGKVSIARSMLDAWAAQES